MGELSAKYKKDYKNVSFKNPRFYKEQEKKSQKRLKLIFSFIIVIIVALVYFLFFSSFFQVSDIYVTGFSKISQDKFYQIVNNYKDSRKFFIFPRNNWFIFSKEGLMNKIGESYLLEDIQVEKKWPNKISITILEKEAKITLLTQNQCFHLDEQGDVVEYCPMEDDSYLKIKDLKNSTVAIGDHFLNAQMIKDTIEAKNTLSNLMTVDVFEIEGPSSSQITVQSDRNYDIYLGTDISVGEQLKRLQALLSNQAFQEQLETLEYIDLRFGEKVYYR